MNNIDVSIVIPVKNGQKYLDSVLKAVFSQATNAQFEVIIIDSGSRDSTLDIAKNYPLEIFQIPTEEFGHGRTRNFGAQIAKGEILVFLNADAIPQDENWLNCLVGNFKDDEKIAGVYSRVYPQPDCNPLHFWEILNENSNFYNQSKIKYIEDFDKFNQMQPKDRRRLFAFQTISCAIRKDFLLRYPFEDLDFGEDLAWSKRIMEKGFKIVFEPGSVVIHSHNLYFSFIKTFKKYFDDARLNKRLLNIWSWYNFPILAEYILYKIFRDMNYVLSLNKRISYKIGWLFYSPIIRLAEFLGVIFGVNSRHLPSRLRDRFSLVYEIKKRPVSL